MSDTRHPELAAAVQEYQARLARSYEEAEDFLVQLEARNPDLHALVEEAIEPDGDRSFPPSPVQGTPDREVVRPGTRLLDRYEVLRPLGEGGQGGVFLARDITHPDLAAGPRQRLVAVKVALDAASQAYLRKEAEMLTRLDHNHLPTVELVEPTGAFVVMEYVEGTSLRDLFEARGRAPYEWEMVAEWVDTVLRVLAHLHSPPPPPEDPHLTRLGPASPQRTTPYVHCDIKPGNLILKSNGALYVVDLGISKSGDASLTSHAPASGGGTVGYGPPEVWSRSAAVFPQTDLYSLGMTAFELVTGKSPAHFTRGDGRDEDAFDRALKESALPKDIERWIYKATRVDLLERFESANAMRAALRQIGRGPTRAPASLRRFAVPVGGALLALVALAVVLFMRGDPSEAERTDAPLVAQADSLALGSRAAAEDSTDALAQTDSLSGAETATGADVGTIPAGVEGPTPAPVQSAPSNSAPPQQQPVTTAPPPASMPAPQPAPATRQVRFTVGGADAGPVLVDGRQAGGSQSLRVGETKRFDVRQGYDVRFAVVRYENGGFERFTAVDGAVSVPIKEGIASIEFDVVADLDELSVGGF